MWLRLSRLGPGRAMAERRLVGCRLQTGNMSLDVARILSSVERIEQLHRICVDHGRLHRWLAESCLRQGDRRQALRQWAMATGHGEVAGVAADLRPLISRRIACRAERSLHRPNKPQRVADAREWLDVLISSDAGPVAR